MSAPAARPAPASLRRRAASFVYEGVLLFGIVTFVGLIYAGVVQQRHALHGRHGLQAAVFVVLGLYFVGFWTAGGQTVAMKAWHVRLVDARTGRPPSVGRALARWLLSWLWFAPALLAAAAAGVPRGGATAAIVVAGIVAYAALTWLRPDRQFFHDALCATRLVDVRADDAARSGARSAGTVAPG